MSTKLFNCHGNNLLNHLKQKNIDIEVQQYPYLSKQDIETQSKIQKEKDKKKDNVKQEEKSKKNKEKDPTVQLGMEEVKVNLLESSDYIYYAKFDDNKMTSGYFHKEQRKLSQRPLWRTVLKFQDKDVFSLGKTKKESLERAVDQVDSKIKKVLSEKCTV